MLIATEQGDTQAMELIIDMKQKLHRDEVISLFDCQDDMKTFNERVGRSDALKNGIDHAVIDDYGNTIFHHLIKTHQNSIFRHLLEEVGGISRLLLDLAYHDAHGNNLVMACVLYENWDILNLLVGEDSPISKFSKQEMYEHENKVSLVCCFLWRSYERQSNSGG